MGQLVLIEDAAREWGYPVKTFRGLIEKHGIKKTNLSNKRVKLVVARVDLERIPRKGK